MSFVVPLCVLVPLLVAILRYPRLSKGAKVIVYYLLLSAFVNLLSAYLAIRNIVNLPLLHLYTCLEFLLIIQFFVQISSSSKVKGWLRQLAIVFIIASLLNSCFLQSIYTYNSYARSVEAILILLLSFVYMAFRHKEQYSSWRKKSYQWFIGGFQIYFSSSLALFILSNFTFSLSKYSNWILWNFHATLVLLMYGMFTYAFLNERR